MYFICQGKRNESVSINTEFVGDVLRVYGIGIGRRGMV